MKEYVRHGAVIAASMVLVVFFAHESAAYPVDSAEKTGIVRLEAYDVASRGESRGKVIPLGALLPEEKVRLRLVDQPGFVIVHSCRAKMCW